MEHFDVISAGLGFLASLILFALDRRRRKAEVEKLEEEAATLRAERQVFERELTAYKELNCVFDDIAKLRNFINSIANLLGYYTYSEWLRWQEGDDSPGAAQHFLSHHRKEVETLLLNMGLGSVMVNGKTFLLGDVLFAAFSSTFLNNTLDPLLREFSQKLKLLESRRLDWALESQKLLKELQNAYKRVFIEALKEPGKIIQDSHRPEVARKYGYEV